MTLTDAKIRAAKPGPRTVKLSDGGGLQLWIEPNSAKRWRLAYRFSGSQKTLAIGVYPATGLREAREAREEAKRLLANGQDPALVKKLAKAAKAMASANTFEAIAGELLEKKRREGKADRTMGKVEWLLGLVRPALGPRPIAEITAPEVLAVLRGVRITRPSRNRPPASRDNRTGLSLRGRDWPRRRRSDRGAKRRFDCADGSPSGCDYRAEGLRRAFTRHRRL